jgi:hypothetical protein
MEEQYKATTNNLFAQLLLCNENYEKDHTILGRLVADHNGLYQNHMTLKGK